MFGARGLAPRPAARVCVPMADGARVWAFVYAPLGVRDEPGSPFAVVPAPAPVVVLHGNGESHEHMGEVVERLARERSVIAIDSRGQGASTRGSRELSYELMALDVLEVMSRLGVTEAHVLGFSDGGIVGLLLARDAASRVLSLTALGANLTPEGLTGSALFAMRAELAELEGAPDVADASALGAGAVGGERGAADDAVCGAAAGGGERVAAEDAVCGAAAGGGERVAAAGAAVGARGRYTEAELLRLMLEQPAIEASSLAGIRCPVCVMAGDHDLVRAEETSRIADSIPGATLAVVADAGHDLPLEAPAAVARHAAATMAAGERPVAHRPLVAFPEGRACVSAPAIPGISVVHAGIAEEAAVLAMYERLLDSCDIPGRETCGWRRGFWPLPHDVSRRLREGTTWVAVRSGDVRDGACAPGARVLGAMSLDGDFGLPGVVPDWEPLEGGESLTCHLLATDPAERGRGIGRALLAAYAREGIRRGCVALRINTSPQSRSNRLYRELGFTLHKPLWFPYEGLPLTPWTNVYELRLDGKGASDDCAKLGGQFDGYAG